MDNYGAMKHGVNTASFLKYYVQIWLVAFVAALIGAVFVKNDGIFFLYFLAMASLMMVSAIREQTRLITYVKRAHGYQISWMNGMFVAFAFSKKFNDDPIVVRMKRDCKWYGVFQIACAVSMFLVLIVGSP